MNTRDLIQLVEKRTLKLTPEQEKMRRELRKKKRLLKKMQKMQQRSPKKGKESWLSRLIFGPDDDLTERRRKASIDAVMRFKHEGKKVDAKVKRTKWTGGKAMTYVWLTVDGGREFETVGVPKDAEVVADVR